MPYKSTAELVSDLEKRKMLIRIPNEVDPNLQMASIHRRVFKAEGPAILYENVKGSQFAAVSNLYGTEKRCEYIFRDTLEKVQTLISLKGSPDKILKSPFKYLSTVLHARKSLPKKISGLPNRFYKETSISELPLIKCWPDDGGAFVTLPLVYTEDPEKPGAMSSNLGMYRVQLNGNDYELNNEVGLHYQIHRGIGVHQSKAKSLNVPLKVAVIVGGPPALTWAAVMPLPEGMAEVTFAGILGNRRFRYLEHEGFSLCADADFIIYGEINHHTVKPEGPFGDHLGYYSLTHDFPVLKVDKVYHRKDAIWPFTVVGRPPQEDSMFGKMIHRLTGDAIQDEIKGLKAVNAVDAAGVHPLLLAIGTERYTPYAETKRPAELLTIANRILGTGQLSLAKYLFILSDGDVPDLDIENIKDYFFEILRRFNPTRDLHFQTNTTIDTLDYSGDGLNSGSKLIIAATGKVRRNLSSEISEFDISLPDIYGAPRIVAPGILAIDTIAFSNYENAKFEMLTLTQSFLEKSEALSEKYPLIVVCDDADFLAANFDNFLWTTFTRSNPASDVYGVGECTDYKHWACKGSVIIDARRKPHHAPDLIEDPAVEESVSQLASPGGPLHGII